MSLPPCVLRLRVNSGHRHLSLWIPLFLVWPLVMTAALALLPIMLVAAAVMWYGGRGKRLLISCLLVLRCLWALRGVEMSIRQSEKEVLVGFR